VQSVGAAARAGKEQRKLCRIVVTEEADPIATQYATDRKLAGQVPGLARQRAVADRLALEAQCEPLRRLRRVLLEPAPDHSSRSPFS
jgi:hypothetical protein